MIFNSFDFLIFFPFVTIVYFLLPFRLRWIFLLIASYYFYMANRWKYGTLLLFTTFIDWLIGLAISRTEDKKLRKWYLAFSLISNLGILFIFKYWNFFADNLNTLLGFHIPDLKYTLPTNIYLPVGISFYTFQSMSYTFDVYKRHLPAEKNLGIFALFVSFFPQLVAGPIERSTNLLPQFYSNQRFSHDRTIQGLRLMIWGFFKKLCIADVAAIYVNQVYNHVHDYQGWPFILATYLFAFQIYCDFSAYSNIAMGTAKILGFDLMENFNRPYSSQSISEFWRRWHISLSTWFKDYLYVPLGGNKSGKGKWIRNILIVFILSGLWHGANWTFVIWGALHAIYIIFGRLTLPFRERIWQITGLESNSKIKKLFKIIITFHLICFAWIFFRANSLSDAFHIISNIIPSSMTTLEISISIKLVIAFIIAMQIFYFFSAQKTHDYIASRPIGFRWVLYLIFTFGILIFGNFSEIQFIYFRF